MSIRLRPVSSDVIDLVPLLASVISAVRDRSELTNSVLSENYAGESRIGRSLRVNEIRGQLPDRTESVRL